MGTLIVTLTVNPALDRYVTADRLVFEDTAYIVARREAAGGRGLNASCVIHSFGGKTLAIAPSGGKTGKRMEQLLDGCGFTTVLVPIRQEIRTNLAISDKQGLTIKLNEPGPSLDSTELTRIEKAVAGKLEKAKWLMLCGSTPPGIPSNFYARLIQKAREAKVRCLLDTDGDALHAGIEAKPSVVTPNQQEAERLLSRVLITRTHFREAAERIKAMGAETVILSLGSRGAIGISDNTVLEAVPPRVDAVCPIGAGDALAAAFVWAQSKGKDFAESLRWAVAAGTASACLPGLCFAGLDKTREVFQNVEVRSVS